MNLVIVDEEGGLLERLERQPRHGLVPERDHRLLLLQVVLDELDVKFLDSLSVQSLLDRLEVGLRVLESLQLEAG